MRNLKLTLAYDGTDFAGWQLQPDRPTIQSALADAIERVCSERVTPHGSGRTDAGVHALGQVASFRLNCAIPNDRLRFALNNTLPPSIRVLSVGEAEMDFHARKSAKAKTYRYRISRGEITSPFIARYVWHYPYPLNEEAMADAAGLIVGEHDFTSFAAVDPEPGKEPVSNVRTMFLSTFRRDGQELVYEVRGAGFLHHMVRNLVGTFVLIGKGTITAQDLASILARKNRSLAGPTAPARGLALVDVEY